MSVFATTRGVCGCGFVVSFSRHILFVVRVKLLVTNDDSIGSVFLHELVRALVGAGHDVFVAAPKTEQSWIGAAKSRHRPVHATEKDVGLGCRTWVIDGTPSDCVNIALAHLMRGTPDAVVSGINIGINASIAFILASGTVSGAWEGAVHGLPAIALSQDLTIEAFDHLKSKQGTPDPDLLATLQISAGRAADLIPSIVAQTRPRSFVVHNLNFPYPCTASSEVKQTVPAKVIIPGLFSPAADDGTHRFVFKLGDDISAPGDLTDRAALRSGNISHTILDYTKLGT
jgi:5'-nucleotidase